MKCYLLLLPKQVIVSVHCNLIAACDTSATPSYTRHIACSLRSQKLEVMNHSSIPTRISGSEEVTFKIKCIFIGLSSFRHRIDFKVVSWALKFSHKFRIFKCIR